MSIYRLKKLLKSQYTINPIEIKKLWGYENSNYLVITDNNKYVFKTYIYEEDLLSIIEAENGALLYLQKNNEGSYPQPIVFNDGSYVKVLEIDGEKIICRLVSFVEGELLGFTTPTKALFQSLGRFISKLDLQLQPFNNNAIKARQWQWDIQYLNLNKKYSHLDNIPIYFIFLKFRRENEIC